MVDVRVRAPLPSSRGGRDGRRRWGNNKRARGHPIHQRERATSQRPLRSHSTSSPPPVRPSLFRLIRRRYNTSPPGRPIRKTKNKRVQISSFGGGCGVRRRELGDRGGDGEREGGRERLRRPFDHGWASGGRERSVPLRM